MTLFSGTHLQVRHVRGFSRMMAQNYCKDVPFWVVVDIAPHLGGKIPQNPNFGGVNWRFQAKLAKSKNMHIIKTVHRFKLNFAQR